MKPKRPTLRQRLVVIWSKRVKLVRVTHPRKVYKYTGLFGPFKQWEVQVDGHSVASCSSGRDFMRDCRKEEIESRVDHVMTHVRELRANGFKVTLPS